MYTPPTQIENKSNVSQTYALLQFKISQDKSLMGCDSYSDEVGDCHGTCSNKLLCDLILGSILFLLLDIICSSYCWLLDWNFKLFHLILKNMYVIQRQNEIQTGKVDINLSFLVLLLNWKHFSWYLQWRLPSDLMWVNSFTHEPQGEIRYWPAVAWNSQLRTFLLPKGNGSCLRKPKLCYMHLTWDYTELTSDTVFPH